MLVVHCYKLATNNSFTRSKQLKTIVIVNVMKLVLVHINKDESVPPPDIMYQAIHQVYQTSKNPHVIVITDRHFVETTRQTLDKLNKPNGQITIVPLDILKVYNKSQDYNFASDEFRSNFWRYTTERFFAIDAYLEAFEDNEPFLHIENDVMLYTDLEQLENVITTQDRRNKDKISFIVKDSDHRGIGSCLYSNRQEWLDFIKYALQQKEPVNDMYLLGGYPKFNTLPTTPNPRGVFDAACLGQYLGGIDPRNIANVTEIYKYNNPTIGFINETSTIDPSKYTILKKLAKDTPRIQKYYQYDESNKAVPIHNLHIHSKLMAPFSSVFDIKYTDIITGDRIVSLADLVFCTRDTIEYHKGLEKYSKCIVKIKDFLNLDTVTLETIVKETGKSIVKIFVYTHTLDEFIKYILPTLQQIAGVKYEYYCHNSDCSFEEKHRPLLQNPSTIRVHAQNITVQYDDKLCLLPIGLANSMFAHGDTLQLYKVMTSSYIYKKTGNLFTSFIGRTTHPIRKKLEEIILKNGGFEKSESMEFKKYLTCLSEHRFALCPRGNGVDTHRFWESLYLGVIPVLIKDESTVNFVDYLVKYKIPHLEMELEFFKTGSKEYFNDELYYETLTKFGVYNIQNDIECLKLHVYKNV